MVVVWDLSDVRGLFDNVLPVGFPVGFFVVVPWLLWHVLEREGESGKEVADNDVAHIEVLCG